MYHAATENEKTHTIIDNDRNVKIISFECLVKYLSYHFLFTAKKKDPHIKKPLNAFMLYMKEMRPVVQSECTLKESAAINQILGRRVSKNYRFMIQIYLS